MDEKGNPVLQGQNPIRGGWQYLLVEVQGKGYLEEEDQSESEWLKYSEAQLQLRLVEDMQNQPGTGSMFVGKLLGKLGQDK